MGPVRPRPHNQRYRPSLQAGQVHIVFNGAAGVRVIPTALMHLRHIRKGVIVSLRAQPHLLPVFIKNFVTPDFQQIAFVVRRPLQRRMSRLPRHPLKPILNVLIQQRRPHRIRVVARLRAFQRFPKSPGNLPQLKRPSVAAAAVKSAGKAPALQPHRRQMRRIQASQRRLRMGGVRQAESPHLAVAPRLLRQPLHRVIPVPPLVYILAEPPLRRVTAAAILHHRHIALFRKEIGFLNPGGRQLVIGGTLQQRRQRPGLPPGLVYIRSQQRPVPHRYHHILRNGMIDLRRRRPTPAPRTHLSAPSCLQ